MSRTVLIIENEPAVAGLFKDVLTADGYEVVVAADGESGLDVFAETGVDAVVVDVVLPRLQGFDLLPRLRNLPGGSNVPVIMVSGESRPDAFAARVEARHDIAAYLQKPVDLERLKSVLRTETDRPNAGQLAAVLPSDANGAATTHEPGPLTVPPQGSLESVPFARVLGGIYAERLTGALMLRKSSVKKLVYFKEGLPIFVKSNVLHECLGRVMVAERLISQDECDRSLSRKHTEPHKRQGELLVEMGSISPHNLEFGLELQMQAKLFDIFSWLEGRYQFNPNVSFEGDPVSLSISPALLIYEGASRAMSTDRIRRDLGFAQNWMLVPSRDPSYRYQALQLDPRADRFLDLIDGSRTAEALLTSGELGVDDAALVLYSLVCTSLVRVAVGATQPVAVPPAEPPVIPVPDAATAAIASDEEVTLARAFGGPRGLNIPRRFDGSDDDATTDLVNPAEHMPHPVVLGTPVHPGHNHAAPSEDGETVERRVSVRLLSQIEAEDDPLGTMDDAEWAHEIDAALDRSWASALQPGAVPPAEIDPFPATAMVQPAPSSFGAAALAVPTSSSDVVDGVEVRIEAPVLHEDTDHESMTEDIDYGFGGAGRRGFGLPMAEPLPEDFVMQAPLPFVADMAAAESTAGSVVFKVPELNDWLTAEPLPEDVVYDAPVPEVDDAALVATAAGVSNEPDSVVFAAIVPDVFDDDPPEPLPSSMVFGSPVPNLDEPIFREGDSHVRAMSAVVQADEDVSVDDTVFDEPVQLPTDEDDVGARLTLAPTRADEPQPIARIVTHQVPVTEVHGGVDARRSEDADLSEVSAAANGPALVSADASVSQTVGGGANPSELARVQAVAAKIAEVAEPVDGVASDDDAWADDIEVVFEAPTEADMVADGADTAEADEIAIDPPVESDAPEIEPGIVLADPMEPVQASADAMSAESTRSNAGQDDAEDQMSASAEARALPPQAGPDAVRLVRDPLSSPVEEEVSEDVWFDAELAGASTDLETSSIRKPPAMTSARRAERALKERELEERLEQLASKTHYEVLELSTDATDAAIRAARAQLESQFHPDRWTPDALTARARRLTEQATLLVRRAADQLLSPAERLRYDRAIGVTSRPNQADAFEAELAFTLGQAAVAREEMEDAEKQFRRAIERDPSEGEYLAALAETLCARDALDEASTLLDRATDLSPHSRAVSLARARLQRRRSNQKTAIDLYRQVLKLDPDCREAREFLAAQDCLFERRTSLLSRLTKS